MHNNISVGAYNKVPVYISKQNERHKLGAGWVHCRRADS